MKNIKRILALLLISVMVFSFAGCHKKNEIAVTVGDVEFTSAYYMCALINADSEAKTKVNENLTDEEQEDTSTVDYYSKKIDKKDYVEWVEDTAIDTLKTIAAYKILCNENKLELDEDIASQAELYASYYWSSYGYSAYFEPNGVSQATYTQYMKDAYYAERYFEFVYGEKGEKEIAASEVEAKLYDSFITANLLNASYSSEMTDAQKTELKTKIEGYATALKDGTKTFKEVYEDYNGKQEETAEETTEEDDTPKPKDEYASILGAKDTAYESDHYDTVKAMALGEVKVIELEDKSGLVLVVKQDIKADEYYRDTLDMTTRHLLKDDEFEKTIEDYKKELKAEINNYAVSQFKVKKIKEPEYS